MPVQLLYLPFFFPTLRFLLLRLGGRCGGKGFLEFGGQFSQHGGCELDFLFLGKFLLGDDLVDLLQEDTYLLHEFATVLLHRLAPYKRVLVGLRLYLCPVDVLFHVKGHKTTLGKLQYQLGEHVVKLVLDTVAKTVDDDEVGLLVTCEPDEVNVPEKQFLYPAAGVDIVHVGIEDDLEHHFWMIWTAPALFVKLTEIVDIQTVNNGIDNANGVVFRNVLIDSLRKKHRLVAYVRAKV